MADGRAILKISDGTDEIDLLQAREEFKSRGWLHFSWTPEIAQWKGGGTWSQSALSDGRQLRYFVYDNVIETINCRTNEFGQDELIELAEDTMAMLQKAAYYWASGWTEDPVYLICRATEETNTRYAIVKGGNIPQLQDWYAQPFIQENPACKATFDNIDIIIERGHWQDTVPGTGNALEISAEQSGEGQEETTEAEEVYIANKHNVAQLSHIFVEDGGVFGANLLAGALPYALLPAVPAANDRVYFGINTVPADTGPFCSLVFDLSQAQANIADIVWEYWNGAWVVLAVQDNTDAGGQMTGAAFDTTGVHSAHWEQPSDWATTAVNGVTGYWVRAEVQDPGTQPPIQQTRHVYSVLWPYVEVAADRVGGTLVNLLEMTLRNQSDRDLGSNSPALYSTRVVIGTRTHSRFSAFTPYINMADEQQFGGAGGWTVAAVGGGAFASDSTTATGRMIRVLNPAAAGTVVARCAITNPGIYGKYHCFLRGNPTSTVIEAQLRGRIGSTSAPQAILTNWFPFPTTIDGAIVDLENIRLPFSGDIKTVEGILTTVALYLEIYIRGDGAEDVDLYELITMPVDECAIDAYDAQITTSVVLGIGDRRNSIAVDSTFLQVDSIEKPNSLIRALLKKGSLVNGNILTGYRTIANGPFFAQANSKQRIWFFQTDVATSGIGSQPEVSGTVQMTNVQRYLGARGSR